MVKTLRKMQFVTNFSSQVLFSSVAQYQLVRIDHNKFKNYSKPSTIVRLNAEE